MTIYTSGYLLRIRWNKKPFSVLFLNLKKNQIESRKWLGTVISIKYALLQGQIKNIKILYCGQFETDILRMSNAGK